MSMPDWVAAYKGPGKEIKEQNGRFYLYERTTVYDKEKKRAKKISGAYLGRITENGLIPKNSCLVSAEPKPDVEYGASKLLFDMSGDIRAELQKRFPECWRYIYVLALLRIVSMEPFKRLHEGYVRSFLSVELPAGSFFKSYVRFSCGAWRQTSRDGRFYEGFCFRHGVYPFRRHSHSFPF